MPGSKFYGLRFGEEHIDATDGIFPRTGLPAHQMTTEEHERMAPIVAIDTDAVADGERTVEQLAKGLGGKVVAEVTRDGVEITDGTGMDTADVDLMMGYFEQIRSTW